MPRPNRGRRLERNERGIYEIRWTEGGRSRRVSTRETDPAAAAAFLAAWVEDVEREADAGSAGSVRGILAKYFTEHVHRKVVGQGTAEIHRRHLEAHFGDMAPARIRKTDVRAYEAARAAGEIGQRAGASTVRRELITLVAALNHAVAEGRLSRADLPTITLPAEGPRRERYLTDDEVAHLFALAAQHRPDGRLSRVERWLHLAYYTARRKTAITRLTWDRVDWTLGTIDFEEPGRQRTKKRRGVAHMHPKLRECLERARREAGDEAVYVLDHPGDIRAAFETLAARSGIAGLTPHVLKHTSITHMLRRGVPIWKVAGATATSAATIEKVYGKHVPEAQREAVEVL